jgi:hypothetical protein
MGQEEAGGGPFRFSDRFVSREERFSIGVEIRTGRHYVSIPVSNQRVDYEEYYEIDVGMFELFLADSVKTLNFVERCRRREEDARLFYQPSHDRGTPL